MRQQSDECARQNKEAQTAAWEALSDDTRQQITAAACAGLTAEFGTGWTMQAKRKTGKAMLKERCLQILMETCPQVQQDVAPVEGGEQQGQGASTN